MIPTWLQRIHDYNPWSNLISALLFMLLFYSMLAGIVYILKILT